MACAMIIFQMAVNKSLDITYCASEKPCFSLFQNVFFFGKRQHQFCSKTPKVYGRSVSMLIKNLNMIGSLV